MWLLLSLLIGLLVFVVWKYLNLKYRFDIELEKALRKREEAIRVDAIKRSSSVILGKVGERLAPVVAFKANGLDPRDARFIGDPVDYVVFSGLKEGKPEKIWFVEVKTGKSKLSSVEKKIKSVVEAKKVGWKEIKLS